MEIPTEPIPNEPAAVLVDWLNWCRLCGKSDLGSSAIKCESFGNLTFTVQKHFSICLSGSETAAAYSICPECLGFIVKLEQFAEKCVKVESVFNRILASNADLQKDINYLQSIRYETGLDEETKLPIVDHSQQDKSTDTNDLSDADVVLRPKREPSPRKRATRPRKPKKVEPQDDYPDELPEIEAEFILNHEDNDDDPTFDIDNLPDVDGDSSDLCDDSMDEINDPISVAELDLLEPKAKRRKTTANDTGPIKCPLCDIEFEKKRLFDTHMRQIHARSENPFMCSKCPKRFATLKKLNIHETVHLPDDQKYVHPCQFCDKRFSKLVNVQAHIRAIHTGDRPFICEECGKSFVAKGGLKEHQMTHSDEYPIQCAHCPKRFKNTARLRIHEDIHKHTAYICPHCGLQLNTKRTLKMHMVVHSDQKKYKCQYCGNEYKRSKTLKNHLIIHTGLRPYTCPWCDKTFANGSNCRSHKKKAHPVELAALEASGQALPSVHIPKLEQLQPN